MGVKPRFPLATKFLLLAIANLVVLCVVALVYIRLQLRQEFESFLMTAARERLATVSRSVVDELSAVDRSQWNDVLARYSQTHGVTFLLYASSGDQIAGSPTPLADEVRARLDRFPGRLPPPPPMLDGDRPPEFRTEFRGPPSRGAFGAFLVMAESGAAYPYWVGVRALIFRKDGLPIRAWLMLASPTLLSNPFFFQLQPWLMVAAAALVISALCWLPLVRGLTRTVGQMTRATAHIAEGRFDVQLPTTRQDELGLLGASIHRMAGRLDSFTRGQKRFLGDVAHELRSPLARMQLALGIIERKTSPDVHDYLRDLQEDVEMMAGLTDELLAFAKAEIRPEALELVPTKVLDAVQRAVRVEAREGAEIQVNIDPALEVKADPEYLFRSIANVLRNAVRYASTGGPIRITAHESDGRVVISVADSGPGVPDEALEKIFTPFYRLEASRDRRTGGTGLGLAIVQSCVQACNGAVECHNRKPSGLEVTITLQAA